MEFYIKTLSDNGFTLKPGHKILDFGCGNGTRVHKLREAGFDAFGCDMQFKDGEHVKTLQEQGHIHIINTTPYELPFENNSFDFIISHTVFEHVHNTNETLAELKRILKPGGVTLHYFPSKWGIIESHVFVPFASVFKSYPYLLFWAFLGIRKKKQKGMSARDIANKNLEYLNRATNYLSTREIQSAFKQHFSLVKFVERSSFPYHKSKIIRFYGRFLSWVPLSEAFYRTFKAVVILTQK